MSATAEQGPRLPPAASGSRVVLLGVAALLSAAAALAIGILLLGDFGGTEGRILATTFLLAALGLAVLPAAVLWDRRRLPLLAVSSATLATTGAALGIGLVWASGESDLLAKLFGTVAVWLVATSQTAALATGTSRRLFAASVAAAAAVAALVSVAIWAEVDREGYARVVAALVVLDALLVALQPVLARSRRAQQPWTFRIETDAAPAAELTVRAASLADAAAEAIRLSERGGQEVHSLERVEAGPR